MSVKLLTLDEAQSMMPLLKSITRDIMETWSEIVKLRQSVEKQKDLPADTKHDLNRLIDRINRYIKEVEALGVFVQEFKRGILTIPTLYHGRRVFLSVMPMQEDTIQYFHELDETPADRQPIGTHRQHFLNRREA